MTSGLVLNEFNLDLSPSGLLVGFGLILVVILVLAAVARVGVVDEGVVMSSSSVEVVAGAFVGHVWGRDVGGLGHGLLGVGLRGSGRVLRRIGRGNVRVWIGLSRLASAKGHELVKRTASWDEWEDEHPQFGRVPEMESRSEREIRFPFSLTPYIPIKQTTPSPARHPPAFPRHSPYLITPPSATGPVLVLAGASLSPPPSFPVPRTALSIRS